MDVLKEIHPKRFLRYRPTSEIAQLCDNLLSGGFSCITRRGFDFEMLPQNVTDFKKLSVEKRFMLSKRQEVKLVYHLKMRGDEMYNNRRI